LSRGKNVRVFKKFLQRVAVRKRKTEIKKAGAFTHPLAVLWWLFTFFLYSKLQQ
jgi:hypothetical protein